MHAKSFHCRNPHRQLRACSRLALAALALWAAHATLATGQLATLPGDAVSNAVPPFSTSLLESSRTRGLQEALPGKWMAHAGERDVTLVFHDDQRFTLDDVSGTYSAGGSAVTLRTVDGEIAYTYDLTAGDLFAPSVLTMSGGDLTQPLKFTSQTPDRDLATYLRETVRVSPAAVRSKLSRIIAIVTIVVVARLIIALMRFISQVLIYSTWGPLRAIYRENKNRTQTIHSLVLNLLKYVVYFGALGRILTELGVNYTTYIASLSVIGLAIGFGSQGLVQDVVTGFFVIFEGQFDVGDMVEISGQTGIVEELGLRMTTLRNYVGQTIVIPNRNIAVMGNYRDAAMTAVVDVAAPAGAADAARGVLERVARAVGCQFEGVVIGAPRISVVGEPDADETAVRLKQGIWPQQQWVIDQQLLPRLKEALEREQVPVPGGRIAVFYYTKASPPPRLPRIALPRLADFRRKRKSGEPPPAHTKRP